MPRSRSADRRTTARLDDGTISEFELPYELSRPDCLEGKNWYNVTDTDYVNRVVDCATS